MAIGASARARVSARRFEKTVGERARTMVLVERFSSKRVARGLRVVAGAAVEVNVIRIADSCSAGGARPNGLSEGGERVAAVGVRVLDFVLRRALRRIFSSTQLFQMRARERRALGQRTEHPAPPLPALRTHARARTRDPHTLCNSVPPLPVQYIPISVRLSALLALSHGGGGVRECGPWLVRRRSPLRRPSVSLEQSSARRRVLVLVLHAVERSSTQHPKSRSQSWSSPSPFR